MEHRIHKSNASMDGIGKNEIKMTSKKKSDLKIIINHSE